MTKEEYSLKKAELKKEYENKVNSLNIEYAKTNNPYKVGDIVEDHIGILLIENITYSFPTCSYRGTELTKKLEPKKRQNPYRRVFQENIKRKVGEQLSINPCS